MQKKDLVSLAEARPDLAAEWNYEKNGNLKPEDVARKSNKKVWWKLPYDVPMDYKVEKLRGKHFEFEWEAIISSRSNGNDCPYLSGNTVWPGFNDLQTINPELAKQWHPTKNGTLTPSQVTYGSKRKVWWLLLYKDSKTGKYFNFKWEATINGRNSGLDCPFLSGRGVWPGFNDLQTINPELAEQWHPTKNGTLTPSQVTYGSNRKVWWLLLYKDSKTGKYFNFEWEATINGRNSGLDCPFLSGSGVWPGFNDLQTVNPELSKQWHPTKNGNLTPSQITCNSVKRVWWKLSYDVPMDYKVERLRGKHFEFEWKAMVSNRNKGSGCPYLNGAAVWPGFNDLQTVNPELAEQWHPTKNNGLTPSEIVAGSCKKVWWILPYDDKKTGQHFDFEWQATVCDRNRGRGCPYLHTYKGEEYIKQYLQKDNIIFTPQQKFPDLIGTGGGQLSYDFSIPSKKYGLILIEYNGIQHYESSEFFGGDEQLKKQKEHDRLKKEYAKKHGYKLIIVKYTYDTYEDVAEYLEKELKKSDESVFDSESKSRLHQTPNGDFPFFVDEMNGEDIKMTEKEAIEELTEEDKKKIGKRREEAGENIMCNKKENVA